MIVWVITGEDESKVHTNVSSVEEQINKEIKLFDFDGELIEQYGPREYSDWASDSMFRT